MKKIVLTVALLACTPAQRERAANDATAAAANIAMCIRQAISSSAQLSPADVGAIVLRCVGQEAPDLVARAVDEYKAAMADRAKSAP
jgi:hypothetical protein